MLVSKEVHMCCVCNEINSRIQNFTDPLLYTVVILIIETVGTFLFCCQQFKNVLEETKGIEQLKVSVESEVDYAEKPSSKPESHDIKEFGGIFGVLLLQILAPLFFLAAHLYCSQVSGSEKY